MSSHIISREVLSSVREQLISANQRAPEKAQISLPPPEQVSSIPDVIPESPPDVSCCDSLEPNADPLLDELLGDIRRSCGTSMASTPSLVSDNDAVCDTVFECRLRRSGAELSSMGVSDLRGIVLTLSQEVDTMSALLVKLLRTKDRLTGKSNKQHGRLSVILNDYAKQNDIASELTFSTAPPLCLTDYGSWLTAWKVLARLPKGIPKFWRKSLWSELSSRGTELTDWDTVSTLAFSEFTMPGDEDLGSQIVKDLHRTGNTGFTTEQEHAVLKRVLLAYARSNSSTGYCQGFNVLAALILKVVHFDEVLALKVMVYLIDHILPENYFAQNLYALSADMAVFRDYLKHFLPELSSHLDSLQREASGVVKKSYSSESPPDIQSIHAYEPPLADVFTMQWFLTLFATSLPRKAVRRVWDLVFLEGSGVLIYTAVAILAVMERDLLQTVTAADFYTVMAQLGERLRKAQLLPSSELMEIVYAIKDSATSTDSNIASISKLREKYTYNICPWASEDDDCEDQGLKKPCPPPTCGGSLELEVQQKKPTVKKLEPLSPSLEVASALTDLQTSPTLPGQLRLLKEHYSNVARQPKSVCCNMRLTPPQARIICPQAKKAVVSPHNKLSIPFYAPDVPDSVLQRSSYLSGYKCVEHLEDYQKKVFTLSYCQPSITEFVKVGGAVQAIKDRRRRALNREQEKVIQYTTTH